MVDSKDVFIDQLRQRALRYLDIDRCIAAYGGDAVVTGRAGLHTETGGNRLTSPVPHTAVGTLIAADRATRGWLLLAATPRRS